MFDLENFFLDLDDNDENDDKVEIFKSLQIHYLKNDVSVLLDDYDDNDELDELFVIDVVVMYELIEHNENNEIVEHFISLCLNDNDRS